MNNLKERRMELGLTQPQVSAWLRAVDNRYDVGMVSRLENGVCLPTPAVLNALSEVLQAPISALYCAQEIETINFIAETELLPPGLPAQVKRVVDCIPRGKGNAISRRYLRTLSGVNSDRHMRNLIETARGLGVLICNDGRGAGYYIADPNDLDDISRQYWKDRKRALSILYRLKAYRKILTDAGMRV